MAVPARKISKTSKRMRRAHDFLAKVSTTACPNCKAVIKPHRVCDVCGYYKGKKVVADKKAVVEEKVVAEKKVVKTKKETKK